LKGWLLDTNVIASLTSSNGAPSVRRWAAAQHEERLFLSILTIGEYQKGIHNLPAADPARHRYAASLRALEARFAGRILAVSDAVVLRWGALSGTIRRDTGHPPPVIDTLLAATALEHQLCLVTRNVRDVVGTGADLLDPWSP
jgi:predicted nucleic acid-binding protein